MENVIVEVTVAATQENNFWDRVKEECINENELLMDDSTVHFMPEENIFK